MTQVERSQETNAMTSNDLTNRGALFAHFVPR